MGLTLSVDHEASIRYIWCGVSRSDERADVVLSLSFDLTIRGPRLASFILRVFLSSLAILAQHLSEAVLGHWDEPPPPEAKPWREVTSPTGFPAD